MKKLLMSLSILLLTQSGFAAVQYEFRQTSRSDMSSIPPSEMTARATLDGERSRVEILAGNTYPPGTYILSTNGAKTMTFVDPTQKQFAELNAASSAAAMGARKITIDKARHEVTKLDDHPVIAGQPADHYRLTMDYEMTVSFGQIPLTQSIHTQIDKWTTVVFGDVGGLFASTGARTGNPQLDEMFDLETSRIKGFALRETMTTITTNNRGNVPDSKLQISPSHTMTREVLVTAIKNVQAGPADFIVPVTYHRFDPDAIDRKLPSATVLSLEPAEK